MIDSQTSSAIDLIRAVGLRADGPGVLGRPIRASGPGVYIIELAAPLPKAPIDINAVGKWLERLPGMRLDNEPTTSKATRAAAARLLDPEPDRPVHRLERYERRRPSRGAGAAHPG